MRVVATILRPDQARSDWGLNKRLLVRRAEERIAPAGDDQRLDLHGPRLGGPRGAVATQVRHDQPAAGKMRGQQREAAAGVGEAMNQEQRRLRTGDLDISEVETADIDDLLATGPGRLLGLLIRRCQRRRPHSPSFSLTVAMPVWQS